MPVLSTSLLREHHRLAGNGALAGEIGGNKFIHVHPTRLSGRIPNLLMIARGQIGVGEGGHLLSKHIIDRQDDVTMCGEQIADGGRGIKGIGIVLEEFEMIRGIDRDMNLLCPTLGRRRRDVIR